MSILNKQETTLSNLIDRLSDKEILIFLVLLGQRAMAILEAKKALEVKSPLIKEIPWDPSST